jgi:D-ribose pyranose/furanose isomerase RbsD
LQEIFFQSNLVNDDQLMQILGLLTGSGMQTMMLVAIQVESIKAMTKHREQLINSFQKSFNDAGTSFDVDLKISLKSMKNDIESKTKEIFDKTVNDSADKLEKSFNKSVSDFDAKVNNQITRMNQSILTEKTTIVQEFNNLKNEFQVQKTLIHNELFNQRDETIKAMDSSATQFHKVLVDAFEQFYGKQLEIEKK